MQNLLFTEKFTVAYLHNYLYLQQLTRSRRRLKRFSLNYVTILRYFPKGSFEYV